VCDDLKVLKVRNRKELATDRNVWNDLYEKAKTHKGLLMEEEEDMQRILFCLVSETVWNIKTGVKIYIL
jgi:hypothetical protein